MLGKRDLAVCHDEGWTYPRQVAEALEALDEVPLPARYGYWAVPGGVAVEVVVRNTTWETQQRVETSLQEHGVPAREVYLRESREQLQRPMPLRGDLREQMFSGMTNDHSPISETILADAVARRRAQESLHMGHLYFYIVFGCVICALVGVGSTSVAID